MPKLAGAAGSTAGEHSASLFSPAVGRASDWVQQGWGKRLRKVVGHLYHAENGAAQGSNDTYPLPVATQFCGLLYGRFLSKLRRAAPTCRLCRPVRLLSHAPAAFCIHLGINFWRRPPSCHICRRLHRRPLALARPRSRRAPGIPGRPCPPDRRLCRSPQPVLPQPLAGSRPRSLAHPAHGRQGSDDGQLWRLQHLRHHRRRRPCRSPLRPNRAATSPRPWTA